MASNKNFNLTCPVSLGVFPLRLAVSVSGLVPARDEPVECLPWTRRTGVCRYLPCPDKMYVPRAGEGGLGRENSDFCLIFRIPSWLMPSRDRSGPSWLNASTWSE